MLGEISSFEHSKFEVFEFWISSKKAETSWPMACRNFEHIWAYLCIFYHYFKHILCAYLEKFCICEDEEFLWKTFLITQLFVFNQKIGPANCCSNCWCRPCSNGIPWCCHKLCTDECCANWVVVGVCCWAALSIDDSWCWLKFSKNKFIEK